MEVLLYYDRNYGDKQLLLPFPISFSRAVAISLQISNIQFFKKKKKLISFN